MSGVEVATHSMKTLFSNDNTRGMLLVDASDAFNSLNRNVALQNIQYVTVLHSLHYLLTPTAILFPCMSMRMFLKIH